jgi:cytochrome c556
MTIIWINFNNQKAMFMKSTIKTWTAALPLILWSTAVAWGQPKTPVTTKEFMHEKLEQSQKLLAALATEDYFTLGKVSQRLSAMSQEANWQAFQNPDYKQFSDNFRAHANALNKAAKEKNIDASTLAYVRMTMSCVDCHKWVRGRVVAERPFTREIQVAKNNQVVGQN